MKAARPVRKGADGKVLRATGVTRRRPTLHKGRGSAQGIAAGVLADSCGKSLTLTGTLTGGYSSTLFHLLYRFSPEIRTEFRSLRGGPLDTALRLPGADGAPLRRRRLLRGRTQQPPQGIPQDGAGKAGPGSLGPLPPDRQQRVPAPLRRGLGAAVLRGAGAAVGDGPGDGLYRLLPAQGLRPGVRHPAAGPGRSVGQGFQAAPCYVPANPAGLPRRLHSRGDGLRSPDRQRPGADAAVVGGQAVPERTGVGGPGVGGKAGGTQGPWSMPPTRARGTSPSGWMGS